MTLSGLSHSVGCVYEIVFTEPKSLDTLTVDHNYSHPKFPSFSFCVCYCCRDSRHSEDPAIRQSKLGCTWYRLNVVYPCLQSPKCIGLASHVRIEMTSKSGPAIEPSLVVCDMKEHGCVQGLWYWNYSRRA